MISFVAQGLGFYGCAFFTADTTVERVIEMVKNSNDPFWEGAEFGDGYVQAVGDLLPNGESTNPSFFMVEFEGVPQPDPVLLFDSGNGKEDMELLFRVKKLLNQAYIKEV